MQHEDRVRAESFGAEAERYDRTRPTYPPGLVDELMRDAPETVLDVGCGTGKAARLLAARGCNVLGVEPDARMAAVARRHGIEVDVARFETWKAGRRMFELVIAAQAWHWVDPTTGVPKARSVLRPSGTLAVFANLYAHEPRMTAAFDAIYPQLAPELTGVDSLALGRTSDATRRHFLDTIAAAGDFEPPRERTYRWEQTYTTEEWIDGLPTHSDHAVLPRERLGALLDAVGAAIDEQGGTITLRYTTHLITALASRGGRRR